MEIILEGFEEIDQMLRDYPTRTQRALVRAMNRAVASGRTAMVGEIARDTGLRSKDVREALPIQQATFNRPEARLGAKLKRIPLIDFGAKGPEPSRGRGRGVTYRHGSATRRLPHAFIARMPSGHRGVFERSSGKFMRTQKSTWTRKRQAIHQKFGPSLGHVFLKFRPLAVARMMEVFDTNFAHEMKFQQGRGEAAE